MSVTDPGADAPTAAPVSEGDRMVLRAEPASARAVVRRVADALRAAGWSPPVRADVALAVDEAVQNAVEHGSEPGREVEVRIAAGPDRARIVVADEGRPDADTPVGAPEPPGVDELRGRGRVIMATLADEVRWRPRGRGTEVDLVFRNDERRAASTPDGPGRAYQERVRPPSTRRDCPVT